MNTPPRPPTALCGYSARPTQQVGQARRHNKAAALLTFLACLGYAPNVELGIVVGTGLALALYLLRP